jgi:DNA-binding transcriptional regulator PaaX
MVRRMLKAEEINYQNQGLKITEIGKQLIDSFIPIKKYADQKWDGWWRLIIFDIPESKRHKRDQLRQLLKLYGYGQWQKLVYLTPHPVTKAVSEWLEEVDLYPQAMCFESKQVGKLSQRALAEIVFDHSKRINDWQILVTGWGNENPSEWIRRWEDLMVSDPWLPSELENQKITDLRQKAGELMKQIVR